MSLEKWQSEHNYMPGYLEAQHKLTVSQLDNMRKLVDIELPKLIIPKVLNNANYKRLALHWKDNCTTTMDLSTFHNHCSLKGKKLEEFLNLLGDKPLIIDNSCKQGYNYYPFKSVQFDKTRSGFVKHVLANTATKPRFINREIEDILEDLCLLLDEGFFNEVIDVLFSLQPLSEIYRPEYSKVLEFIESELELHYLLKHSTQKSAMK